MAHDPDSDALAESAGVVSHDYRPDIDGLRAIAVVAVILFHLAPNRLPAGGVGVDLFFVVSGYLVGGRVVRDIRARTFSLKRFYLKRVRRIVPALLVMILAVTLASLALLYPWEMEGLSRSALAAVVGASNVYFFQTSNYFAPDSAGLPLLHTWSLGVEEQFYLVLSAVPLFFRGGKGLGAFLVLSAAVSLWISQHQTSSAPTAGFYLLPSRWWELMIGVLAARVSIGPARSRAIAMVLAVVGLILVVGSIALLKPANGFPGLAALPPCLGCALLLIAGAAGSTPIGALLGSWPLRIVGLASYSLYLWHWPVIVLYRFDHVIGKLAPRDIVLVLLMTGVLGFASWRWIERPFRDRGMRVGVLLAWCGALAALAGALQLVVLLAGGFPARIPPAALALARYAAPDARMAEPSQHCVLRTGEDASAFDARHCLRRVAGAPNLLLVGDSHAAMLWAGFRRAIPRVNVQLATYLGCAISLDPNPATSACDRLMHLALVDVPRRRATDAVVLTWRWQQIDAAALATLASRLARSHVPLIVIGPTPGYTMPVARVLAEGLRRHDDRLKDRAIEPRLWRDDATLAAICARLGIAYLSPIRAMCPDRRCTVTDPQGHPLYFDGDHYTAEGAREVVDRLRRDGSAAGAAFRRVIEAR